MGHYIGLSDGEFEEELLKWKKPEDDFETLAIRATIDPGTFAANSLVVPIVTSSVFVLHGPAAKQSENSGYHYGRCGNPTRNLFESAMAKLDGAKHSLAFSSGVAAISAVVQILRQGDHIIYVQCTNGDSDWLFRNKWKDFGIQVEFTYSSAYENILQLIKPNTKIVWLESPANPTLAIVDIGTIAREVHAIRSDILITVDNTFMTPVLQQPLELGADIAIYSCTKYLCGHADVTMGSLTFNSDELYKRLQENQICLGGIPSPFDCYLMISSLKTLPLRMKKHFSNGLKIAHFLENHECVERALHPGLKSHPHHELALSQQYGHSGMVGFILKGGIDEGNAFLDALRIFQKAPSLGADVSLASLPSTASHSWLPESERLKLGICANFVRLSVGLENAEKLIQDLDQALYKAVPVTSTVVLCNGHDLPADQAIKKAVPAKIIVPACNGHDSPFEEDIIKTLDIPVPAIINNIVIHNGHETAPDQALKKAVPVTNINGLYNGHVSPFNEDIITDVPATNKIDLRNDHEIILEQNIKKAVPPTLNNGSCNGHDGPLDEAIIKKVVCAATNMVLCNGHDEPIRQNGIECNVSS